MNNLHVKTGDNVMVISGKCKGKTGKVLQTSPKEGKVIVEGLNMVTKHVKPRRAGLADDGLLAGDLAQVGDDGVDDLGVLLGLTSGNVDDDLIQLGDLHNALVAELLVQGRSDLVDILFLQTCHCVLLPYSSAPHLRQTRTVLPSLTEWPTRVALPHLGQTGMTLQA